MLPAAPPGVKISTSRFIVWVPVSSQPLVIKTRPSGSRVAVGYQRPWRMSTWRVQVSATGSKIQIWLRPKKLSPPVQSSWPPTNRMRPSASGTWPAQKRFDGGSTRCPSPVTGS
jgi:hypothetical protein